VPPLDDPRRKLAWADKHLRVLEKDMRKKLGAKEYTITREAYTEVTEAGIETRLGETRFLNPPDLPPDWALLIGDFASNARSSLDHLAWQLALRNTQGASHAQRQGLAWPPERTEFPIYADISDPRYAQALKTKLNRFRAVERKIVSDLQPHNRGNLAHAETLWLLHHVRNTDAHRTLHTVLASVPFSVLVQLYASGDLPGEVKKLTATVGLAPGDTLKTTMKIGTKLAPYVTFDQRGADFHGQEVLPLLNRCRDEVERILGLF
jgi:hypothetical protein